MENHETENHETENHDPENLKQKNHDEDNFSIEELENAVFSETEDEGKEGCWMVLLDQGWCGKIWLHKYNLS